MLKVLDQLLKHRQQRKGTQRSAAFNTESHQKTPAWIQAVVMDALEYVRTHGDTPLAHDPAENEGKLRPLPGGGQH